MILTAKDAYRDVMERAQQLSHEATLRKTKLAARKQYDDANDASVESLIYMRLALYCAEQAVKVSA